MSKCPIGNYFFALTPCKGHRDKYDASGAVVYMARKGGISRRHTKLTPATPAEIAALEAHLGSVTAITDAIHALHQEN